MERLDELTSRYAPLSRELIDQTREFEKAQDAREKHRLTLGDFRDKVNTHIDENEKGEEVNMDEVENLCQMIDQKDKHLLLDLMKLKDQLNQKRIDKHGFNPDSQTASSILVNEIMATGFDQLKREQNNIDDDIAQNSDETDKLKKIIAKYQDSLAKQAQQEKDAIDVLMIQQEELKDLHKQSKELSNELQSERAELLQAKIDNKKKLAKLNECDDLGVEFHNQIEEKKSEIQEKKNRIGDLDETLG
jgi:chromosome segregation ATPase